ncbi:MAG: AI-2E family transporter [Firmicutes bacterium]|nr:AI-2E family transporter [Bacillota bacterium]
MSILTNPKIWRVFLLIALGLTTLYFLYLVRSILPPFAWAVVLAYLLNPLVVLLECHGIPRMFGILLIYLGLAALVVLLVTVGLPTMSDEIDELVSVLPHYTQHAQDLVQNAQNEYAQAPLPHSVREAIDQGIERVQVTIIQVLRDLVQGMIGLFSGVLGLVLVPFLAFYILKDVELIKKKLISLLPKSCRGDILTICQEIDQVLSSFIRGHLMVCCLVGVLTGVSMFLLGVKFSLIIGLIAGIADLVPYIGPIISAIPAVGLAMLQSPLLAVYVVIVFIVIHQIESNVITPKIMGDCVGLHPLVVVFALLAGGHLLGIVGLLLAVPGVAVVRVVANYFYQKILNTE